MIKKTAIILAILLIAACGIAVYALLFHGENGQAVSSAESIGKSPLAPSSLSSAFSAPQNNLPSGWADEGIFSAFYSKAYEKLSSLTLAQKVGQMILARCISATAVSDIQTYHLGGFVLFDADFKNKTKAEVVSAIQSYQKASPTPMFMAVDEEGGTIVRISSNPKLYDRKFLSPQQIYASGGLGAVRTDTLNKANLLKSLGLNLNLAPVADVSTNPTDYIYPRTLGKPAKETGEYVATVVKAMKDSGLSSALKHFPGYGNNVDTHKGIAVDNRPYSTFETSDFLPFEKGIAAGAESILVSHNIIQCMESGVPASLSPVVHRVLRNSLHFTGVIMTDDLSMDGVVDYAKNTAGINPAVQAVLAGNDLLLLTNYGDGYSAVLAAAENGTIPKELIDRAVFRILAWKYAKGLFA